MIRVSIEPSRLVAGLEAPLVIRFTNAGTGTCTDIAFKLDLPPGFLLLGGRNRVDIAKLPPGEEHVHELIVEPSRPGDFAMVSTNFAYRDQFGVPFRDPDWRARISVAAARPAPEQPVTLGIACAGGELALGEWDVLKISVRNATGATVSAITMTVSGPLRIEGSQAMIPALADGEAAEASFPVFAAEGGRHVPIITRVTYSCSDGPGVPRRRAQEDHLQIVVRRPAPRATASAADGDSRRQTVLYLTAGPRDLELLRSSEEMRHVKERLQLGRYRDSFKLEYCPAARLADIGQALGDYEPRIVHFSGHGDRDGGGVYVEDEMGYSDPVSPDGLAALFGMYAHTIRCVIVNACHSMRLAEAMAGYIDHVVAMRGEIADEAAIVFSVGFYQGLFAGRRVQEAFDLGRALLQAKQTSGQEYKTPVLLTMARS